MNIFISQPKHEEWPITLENDIKNNSLYDLFLFPEGYLRSSDALTFSQELALKYRVSIATSLRENNQDTAIIINQNGHVIYQRPKTSAEETTPLNMPLSVTTVDKHHTIGFLLCMEILKGIRDLPKLNYDLILQPIGVGMFSEEQFQLWLNEAKKIAKKFNTTIIGTSHADGSYKNCGVSIPIAYCINSLGEEIFVAHNDLKNRVIELNETGVKEILK